MSLLDIRELEKTYGRGIVANDGITLAVEAGEVFGLLGPNGAGKTTLIHQVIGLLRPTAGSIHIAGSDVVAAPGLARRLCSFQPQSPLVVSALTVERSIELIGRLRGGERRAIRRRTKDLLRALDLERWAQAPGERLSGGIRRLVGFCMAAVEPGRVVILDEPTDEVDPLRRRLLWQEVRRLGERGSAILLVTHDVAEADRAVDRVAILARGRILAIGSPLELRNTDDGQVTIVEVRIAAERALPALPEFLSLAPSSGAHPLLEVERERLLDAVAWCQEGEGDGAIDEFRLGTPTLEQRYVRLVDQKRRNASDQAKGHESLAG